jgi:hypothetical protein
VRLERWDNDRVRALAQVDRADSLSNDLIDLLRTPLLLDVFLRTFKRGEPELRARGFFDPRDERGELVRRALCRDDLGLAGDGQRRVIDALFRALPAAEQTALGVWLATS